MDATVRTTIALPATLMDAIDRAIEDGEARSRNELFARAMRLELDCIEDERIAAGFREMAADPEYLREAAQIMAEFESADRESWHALDAEYGPYPAD